MKTDLSPFRTTDLSPFRTAVYSARATVPGFTREGAFWRGQDGKLYRALGEGTAVFMQPVEVNPFSSEGAPTEQLPPPGWTPRHGDDLYQTPSRRLVTAASSQAQPIDLYGPRLKLGA